MARSAKTSASKSGRGSKARGRPAAKKSPVSRKEKPAASRKTMSKTAASRKKIRGKTPAPKSPAGASKSGGGVRARGRANTASRATKTASKRASASRKQSSAKRALGRSGAQGMRRTENANLGAAVTNPGTDAMALGTEVLAGAIQAGGEIVAATADMAESAARAATAVSTGVVSERSQDEAGSKPKRKRQGRRAGP